MIDRWKIFPPLHWKAGLRTLVANQLIIRKIMEGDNLPSDKNIVRTVSFALIGEILELSNELGWKPWRGSAAPSKEKILDEFADVTAYYATLASIVMDRCGVSSDELAEAYMRKLYINLDRARGNVPGYVPIIPAREDQTPIGDA